MCDKKKGCSRTIDPCLEEKINKINKIKHYKTLLSCCGHGKYPASIVVHDKEQDLIFEWFTGIDLLWFASGCPKGRKRFYRKDWEGYYFIPQCVYTTHKRLECANYDDVLEKGEQWVL